ncbi:MAG: radical SAM protein [Deltaproteobacteria bacterium]|nr:radical SAM protein [Deltaproteobacteria bacterium]
MERKERLHICLGTQCNNNCVFCMEEDRESRRRRLGRIDTAQVQRILSEAPVRDEVMFTAGEPTLRADLLDLVRRARELGFERIGLITNGRRFAYADYLEQAVDAGLNHILVSIHGPDARLHDALTRTPGAFEQTVAGMANLAELRRSGAALRFVTTTVLNRRNLGRLEEHVRFLRRFAPDQIVFNCIQPVGRGERHFATLVPRYSDVVSAFADALARLGQDAGRLFLLDVPACLTGGLPQEAVGFVELHRHFEPEERDAGGNAGSPAPERERRGAGQDSGCRMRKAPGTAEEPGRQADECGDRPSTGNGALRLVTKEATDRMLRVYGPDCPACAAFKWCDGIWRRYADEYGFDEFVPLGDERRVEKA